MIADTFLVSTITISFQQNLSVFVYGLQKRYFRQFCVWIRTLTENEILADARMKSANADEIFGGASDEIKSTLPSSRRISSPQGISSSKTISSTRKGGFNWKKHLLMQVLFSGGGGRIRTIEAKRSRFTVCPLWPLGNSPVFGCVWKTSLV